MGTISIGGVTFAEAIMRVYNRAEVQAYLARRGTRYGKLNNEWADELNKLRKLYGQAAYQQMLGRSESLFTREAVRMQLQEAKKGSDADLVIEKRDALRDLYERARSGG